MPVYQFQVNLTNDGKTYRIKLVFTVEGRIVEIRKSKASLLVKTATLMKYCFCEWINKNWVKFSMVI